MMSDLKHDARPPTRRPRDRKRQIVRAASDLFHRRGYPNVSTGDIASAVGITAGALYRHFSSKQELLGHAVVAVLDEAETSMADLELDLRRLVEELSRAAAGRRDLGVLWNRESRHLDTEQRALLRARVVGFVARLTAEMQALRPDLAPAEADLLSWSILAVLTSPSYHATPLPEDALRELLCSCALVVARTPLEAARPVATTDAPRDPGGLRPTSRREALIAEATRLFYLRGYQAVTMEDIGAAVGVTSAAVYKYFPSKADLLNATISRAAEPLQLGLGRALSRSDTPEEGLKNVLTAYIEFALVHHHLVGILVSEVTNLPDVQRHSVRRQQAEYVAEWVRLLSGSRPELDRGRARFVVQAALTLVNDITRTPHLMRRPDLAGELYRMCDALLHVEL